MDDAECCSCTVDLPDHLRAEDRALDNGGEQKKDSMTPCKTVYLKVVNSALEKIRIFTQNSSASPEEAIDPAAASSRTGSCNALPGGSRSAADRRKAPTRGGLNTLKRVQGGFEVFREFQLHVPATP